MKENKEVKSKKKNTRTANRINYHKREALSESHKDKKQVEDIKDTSSNKEKKSPTTFNLIEVIIIMIITSFFGILVGSGVAYFKDNVIDNNNVPHEFDEFIEVYNDLSNEYYSDIDQEAMIEAGIKGMVGYLGDPYTSYLDSSFTSELNDKLEGEYIGIGTGVATKEDGSIYIATIENDSPAFNAGLQEGDIIEKVDGKDISEFTSSEVSKFIKNLDKEEFEITLRRGNDTITTKLKKEKIELLSVAYHLVDNTKIGYISIEIFAKNTKDQFEKAMNELINLGIQSVIIDVRNNSGGYLSSAEDIASLFLNKGDTIYQLNTKGNIELKKTTIERKYNLPVVLLVNESSASASEVLAAALNENINALLVGEKTYGKGTVQKAIELKSGSMVKYTIQEWYTPKGNRVNGIGLTPNEIVIPDKNYDNQLQKAIDVLSK